jgi:acetylornithine aminotransferase/acetylornithine/N-succinyldiaminopimelate aminotransferase
MRLDAPAPAAAPDATAPAAALEAATAPSADSLATEAAGLLDAWTATVTERGDREADWQLATYDKLPLTLVRGDGSRVLDASGRWYWDLYGGHAVALIGHAHPLWAAVVGEQAKRFTFYSNVVYQPLRTAACRTIVEFAPKNLTRVFLSNSGAEANEVALKMARHHTGRKTVISFDGAFHGRTAAALAVTASEKYRNYSQPGLSHTRWATWGEIPELDDDVAAIILEPIQSLNGMRTATREWLHALRAACDANGTLLILDEVQSAWGRLGANFAADLYDVRADFITGAKSAGGGFPIGVTLVDEAVADKAKNGDQGSTFGAGALACAAILATHHVLREEGLVERAKAVGAYVAAALTAVIPNVELRGHGCLLGVKLDQPVKPLVAALRDHGFIVGGSDDPHVMRLMPPLNVPFEVIDAFASALAALLASRSPS